MFLFQFCTDLLTSHLLCMACIKVFPFCLCMYSFLGKYQPWMGGEGWNGVCCFWVPLILRASGNLLHLLFSIISPVWQYQTHSFKIQDTGLSKNKEQNSQQLTSLLTVMILKLIKLKSNWKSCYFTDIINGKNKDFGPS